MKAIAFDLGKVLFDFDYNIALDKLRGRINVDPQTILARIYENDFGLDFEQGFVSGEQFFLRFRNDYDARLDYAEFAVIWSDIFTPNRDIIALAGRLRSRYPLQLISNINVLHFEHLYRLYPQVFGLFHNLILSYQVKAVKPQEKIYASLKTACGCAYADIVYIDDRADLIRESSKLGLVSLQFTSLGKLIEDLRKLDIIDYPGDMR